MDRLPGQAGGRLRGRLAALRRTNYGICRDRVPESAATAWLRIWTLAYTQLLRSYDFQRWWFMARLGWITDIHLNFVSESDRYRFYRTLGSAGLDRLLISGDIGEAPNTLDFLAEMAGQLGIPIDFVLGNHDFYRSSISEVRSRVGALADPNLNYLSIGPAVHLDGDTLLVGHDGWGDARHGDFLESPVILNDYLLIEELAEHLLLRKYRVFNRDQLQQQLGRLGDEAADHLREQISRSIAGCRRCIVVTHVPPFREGCLYKNQPSDDHWVPHFTCKAVGDLLGEVAEQFPDTEITVLCGHIHHKVDLWIRENLHVLTGPAEYKRPVLERVFEF